MELTFVATICPVHNPCPDSLSRFPVQIPCPDSLSRFPVQNPLSIERGRNSGPPVNISGFEVLCDTVQKTVISYFVDVQGGSFLLLSCLQEQTRLKQARKPGVASSEPRHTYQLKRFKIPCWVLCVSVFVEEIAFCVEW